MDLGKMGEVIVDSGLALFGFRVGCTKEFVV